VEDLAQAAGLAMQSCLKEDTPVLDRDERYDQLVVALFAGLTEYGKVLDAMSKTKNEVQVNAVDKSVTACRTDSITPSVKQVEVDYGRTRHGGEYAVYVLNEASRLSGDLSNRTETIAPAVSGEAARLAEPDVKLLLETGRLGRLSGATTIAKLVDWLPPSAYPVLRETLVRYDESRILDRKAVLEQIRPSVDALRPDRLIGKLPGNVVRAIGEGAKVRANRDDSIDFPANLRSRRLRLGRRLRREAQRIGGAGRRLLAHLPIVGVRFVTPPPPAEVISDYLRILQTRTADEMEKALSSGLPNVNGQVAAGHTELQRQLLGAAQKDLKMLCDDHAQVIWGPEYASLEEQSSIRADWQAAVDQIKDAARELTGDHPAA
jgi:hypothetical protein